MKNIALLLGKGFVVGLGILLAFGVAILVGSAADILTVDKDGTVRLRISDSGTMNVAAADNGTSALKVTQTGTYSAIEASGRSIMAAKSPFNLTGTVTISNVTTDVTGSGTLFTKEVKPGDRIEFTSTSDRRIVESVTSDTLLNVASPYGSAGSGSASNTQFSAAFETSANYFVPAMIWTQNPSTAWAGDSMQLLYRSKNDAGDVKPGGMLRFRSRDITAGSEDCDLTVDLNVGGAFTPNVFTVNGANVGVGTTSPAEKFEIEWAANTDVRIGRGTTDTDITFITLRDANGALYYVYPNGAGGLTVTTTKP